jgi:hypothetical protein
MVIRKELKNATFEYNEEKKIFTIMEADGFNGYIELNKIYAFSFMRFVIRMAQRNWLKNADSFNKTEELLDSIEEEEDDPNQLELFN